MEPLNNMKINYFVKIGRFLLYLLGMIIISFAALLIIINNILNTPPSNDPQNFIKHYGANHTDPEKPVVMTIGDSITHGVMSHNYSKMIEDKLSAYGYQTVNAGINSDLAYSVVQRIDDILACKPKIVTVLIGTNDVMSTFPNENIFYALTGRIPFGQKTSLDFYIDNLSILIRKLKSLPDVEIYLYSLPVIGEDLDSFQNKEIMRFSEAIKKISEKENLTYLPLNERMQDYLTQSPTIDGLKFGELQFANVRTIIQSKVLGYSWNKISEKNKLQLTTENIHLNEKGAAMVANLALEKILPSLQ